MSNHTELVREAAGAVIDPELRRSLGELGMIGSVSTENNTASVEVRLTISGCPAAQKIESDVRAAALSVSGIEDVTVDVQVMTGEERAELLARLRPGGPKQNPFG
ncbi:MAG: iron-sulfur cluster assembly protein, partial [Aurantimicrobium sp.]